MNWFKRIRTADASSSEDPSGYDNNPYETTDGTGKASPFWDQAHVGRDPKSNPDGIMEAPQSAEAPFKEGQVIKLRAGGIGDQPVTAKVKNIDGNTMVVEWQNGKYAGKETRYDLTDAVTMASFDKAAENKKKLKLSKSNINEEKLNEKLKNFIENSDFFKNMFRAYGVPMSDLRDKLKFKISNLDGKYAKSDSNHVYLDNSIFEDYGNDFEKAIHFVIHEMTHWLTRQREKRCYFSDPEEMEAFSLGIAYEIGRGESKDNIESVYLPIIEEHFDSKEDAKKLFDLFYYHGNILKDLLSKKD